MDDGLNSLFHVLYAHPFQARMERVLAGEDVGAGQPHERQPRAVRAAADGSLHRGEPDAADRLHCIFNDLGMSIDHLLHIEVLLLELQAISGPRNSFMTSLTMRSSKASFCFNPSSVKSRTMKLTVAFSRVPTMPMGCRKPCLPSVVSGEQLSLGRRSTTAAAILIACSILPLAKPGWVLTPSMVSVAPSAEKVSSSILPAVSPSIV